MEDDKNGAWGVIASEANYALRAAETTAAYFPGLCPRSRIIGTEIYRQLLRSFGIGADLLPALGALLRVENFLAQADGFGRDFDKFVVGDELDGLFEAQLAVRDEANGLVGARRAHVGLLFFFGDVDVHIGVARVFANDHAFVYFLAWADEQFAAFL